MAFAIPCTHENMDGAILLSDRFVWDEKKHKANIEKHDVSFQEAASVFDDDNAEYKKGGWL